MTAMTQKPALSPDYPFLQPGSTPLSCPRQSARSEDYLGLMSGEMSSQPWGGSYYEAGPGCAQEAGANGMIVYNDQPGMVYMSITAWTILSPSSPGRRGVFGATGVKKF